MHPEHCWQAEGGEPAFPVRTREAPAVLGPALDLTVKKQHGHIADSLSQADDSALKTSVMLGQK